MRKDNKQVVKVKNIKRNKIICYISLFFLVVLLFLPKALRIFVKEKDPSEEKIVELLNCNKTDESVSSTFLNGEPQIIHYQIFGDHTGYDNAPDINIGDETTSSTDVAIVGQSDTNSQSSGVAQEPNTVDSNESQSTSQSTETQIPSDGQIIENQPSEEGNQDYLTKDYIKLVGFFSTITYSDTDNVTVVKTEAKSIREFDFYEMFFSNSQKQQNYFTAKGFTCSMKQVQNQT